MKSWMLLLVSGVAEADEAEEINVVMADGL